jgi:hypothetical protein
MVITALVAAQNDDARLRTVVDALIEVAANRPRQGPQVLRQT